MIGTTLPFTLATSATFLGWAALCAWEANARQSQSHPSANCIHQLIACL